MPLTEICKSEYTEPRQRQLFKNIIYVGALTRLLDMIAKRSKLSLAAQFKGKQKLIAPNVAALGMGYDYALENLDGACALEIAKSEAVGERIFIGGNDAAALGAVYGGATVCAWYPITPSTSLAEAFAKHCKRFRVDPETARTNSPSSRPRTRSPPSAW